MCSKASRETGASSQLRRHDAYQVEIPSANGCVAHLLCYLGAARAGVGTPTPPALLRYLVATADRTTHHLPSGLGLHSGSPAIRESGLWNVNHVDGDVHHAFATALGDLAH
jgi:hypothetical protein